MQVSPAPTLVCHIIILCRLVSRKSDDERNYRSDMIALLAAMKTEITYLKKAMTITRITTYKSGRVYQGTIASKDCLLMVTGVGKQHAQQATEFITEKYPVGLLISTGFAGALNSKSRVGDIVIYSGINCGAEPPASPCNILCSDTGLIDKALKNGENQVFCTILGQGVTIAQICATKESKYNLGQVFKADAVDMESYWIGEIAGKKGLPFITVRSVSDSAQDDLSFLDNIVVKSKVRPLRALSYFVCHPAQIKKTADFFFNFRKAGRNLGVFMQRLIQDI